MAERPGTVRLTVLPTSPTFQRNRPRAILGKPCGNNWGDASSQWTIQPSPSALHQVVPAPAPGVTVLTHRRDDTDERPMIDRSTHPSTPIHSQTVLSAFMPQHRAGQSAFVTWRRNQGKQFFRLGCFQDSERYRRATHVAKAARHRRNMLADAGPATEKVSEFVVPSAISSC
jgi:hypothetical protein